MHRNIIKKTKKKSENEKDRRKKREVGTVLEFKKKRRNEDCDGTD